ncbi:MAG: branched-chain amino acid ABC transporter permease [Gaiellaceae bacterium]
MALAFQVLVTGAAAGAVYGLLAVGHSLIYRLTGVVNFAFGDLVGLGVFATLLVAAGTGPVTQIGVGGGRFALALVAGVLVCVAASVGSYLYAVEPYLARGSTLGWVGATLAVAFAVNALVALLFTRSSYVFPDPLPFREVGTAGFVTLGGVQIQVRAFFVVAVALCLAALATWILTRTRFGRGLQAIAADSEAAQIVGVPVRLLVAGAFGLAGGLAALAAITAAPSGAFATETGVLLGVKGLVAALLVRFGSAWSAFAAGIGLGIAEAAIAGLTIFGHDLGPQWREVLPLGVALLVVALRPAREALEEQE